MLFGFPLGWAVLTAVGASLLASSGAATGIDHYRKRQQSHAKAVANDASRREFRRAIRAIRVELVANRDTLREIVGTPFIRTANPLRTVAWGQFEGTLLDYPDPEPHRVGSDIYRELRAADNNWYLFNDPTREHQPTDLTQYGDADAAIASKLLDAVETAVQRLTELDEV